MTATLAGLDQLVNQVPIMSSVPVQEDTFLRIISTSTTFIVVYFLACPVNFWGKRCEERCLCQNAGLCHNVDGTCDCPPGWRGDHCQISEWLQTHKLN